MDSSAFLLLFCSICASALFCSICASAQDVIVKKDGSTILSKVIEIGTDEVKYKKFSNQSGPTYTIIKSEIQAINYENGEIERIDNDNSTKNKTGIIRKYEWDETDYEINQAQINYFNNKEVEYTGKAKNSNAKYEYRILKLQKDSKIANSQINASLFFHSSYIEKFSGKKVLTTTLDITLTNKTDKIIYIDLANSFYREGLESQTMFTNSATEVSKGKNSGVGVNAGSIMGAIGVGGVIGSVANGVNLGGSKSSSSTTITYSDRIIRIAPQSQYNLPKLQFYISQENKILNTLTCWMN